MDIESSIQQYLIGLKETTSRERLEFDLSVLARLQDYLQGDAALEGAEAIRAADLRAFIRDWYREGEDVTPEIAVRLVVAVLGWAHWLERQRQGSEESLTEPLVPLQEELPRAVRAAEALRRHAHREDLDATIPVEAAEGGSPLGTIGAGLSRVVRPKELDYARAEEDTFEVIEVGDRSVGLLSPARAQLGEGPAAPVTVPARAARLLRTGDILHVEIAPAARGWEILHVETVYPGGLDDRP